MMSIAATMASLQAVTHRYIVATIAMTLRFDINIILVNRNFFPLNRRIGLHFVSNNKSNVTVQQVHIEYYITSTRHQSVTLNIDGFLVIIQFGAYHSPITTNFEEMFILCCH